MPFLYLLFAHLTADFLLQPNRLVKWKYSSNVAILIHVFIHFVVTMVFLFPYWMNITVLLVSLFLSVFHFFVDVGKIFVEKRFKHILEFFVIDQVIHLASLFFFGAFLIGLPLINSNNFFIQLYLNPAVIVGFILLLIVTRVYEIFRFQFLRTQNPRAVFVNDNSRFIRHLVVFGAVYAVVLIFGALINVAISRVFGG